MQSAQFWGMAGSAAGSVLQADSETFTVEHLALLAQLEVQYADGSSERIITDDAQAWRAATGPILMNSIYDGETYDARLEHSGWSTAGFDDSDWKNVRTA